ncbi:hypothetical protein NC652_018749 [Populus alba x Populus x berolinensis]|nr:hypothetical protein NC651_017961 [Populus alba x Populus x berolinensis]KAJ6916154.1 hypothetical protein NC652_018749 [Populus alba x Populus x berolinensis]
MTRPKSEGRPNYCFPRCPTSMILSVLSHHHHHHHHPPPSTSISSKVPLNLSKLLSSILTLIAS